MSISCLFCNKIYVNNKSLKTHYINNTCKSELLNNHLNLHNYIKHIITYNLTNTCLFCNTVYSRKYNFERHLSNNSCKTINLNQNQYKLYNCILSIINHYKKLKVKNEAEEIKEQDIEKLEKLRLQKINRTEYLKKWKEQNKDKIISYRVKYKEKLKNYIVKNNHH